MSRRLSLRPEAMEEIQQAAAWYGERGVDLDTAFIEEVSRVLRIIRGSPKRYPSVDSEVRKAVLRRFPYIILYRARGDEVVVIACIHGHRNPMHWQERL